MCGCVRARVTTSCWPAVKCSTSGAQGSWLSGSGTTEKGPVLLVLFLWARHSWRTGWRLRARVGKTWATSCAPHGTQFLSNSQVTGITRREMPAERPKIKGHCRGERAQARRLTRRASVFQNRAPRAMRTG